MQRTRPEHEWKVASDADLARKTQRLLAVGLIALLAASLLCIILMGAVRTSEQATAGPLRISAPDPGRKVAHRASGAPGAPGQPGGFASGNDLEAESEGASGTHFRPAFDTPPVSDRDTHAVDWDSEGQVLEW